MKSNLLFKAIIFSIVLASSTVFAQVKIGTNPTSINAGSALEIESSNQGVLLPRVSILNTTVWGLLGTAVAGMQIYNTNSTILSGTSSYPIITGGVGIYYWDGGGWVATKREAASTGNTQSLRIPLNGYTSSNGLTSTTTTLVFQPATFNTIDGAVIGANQISLPSGIYRVTLTISGKFSGSHSSNVCTSYAYVNDVLYQGLSGFTTSGTNGSSYTGTALIKLDNTGTISFKNTQQTPLGETFTVYAGTTLSVASIERIQ